MDAHAGPYITKYVTYVIVIEMVFIPLKVFPALCYLAKVINEIFWEDRLSPYNHTPHFPFWFTGIVDTFPLHVLQPHNSTLRRALFNPKYGGCVYKGQLGINFLGAIVLCTGPHLGLCYDGHIWQRTGAPLLEPWEWWLGDGAYPFVDLIVVCLLILFDFLYIYFTKAICSTI